MARKKQDGSGLAAYPRAFAFFEKMRLLENKPKQKTTHKRNGTSRWFFPNECQ